MATFCLYIASKNVDLFDFRKATAVTFQQVMGFHEDKK